MPYTQFWDNMHIIFLILRKINSIYWNLGQLRYYFFSFWDNVNSIFLVLGQPGSIFLIIGELGSLQLDFGTTCRPFRNFGTNLLSWFWNNAYTMWTPYSLFWDYVGTIFIWFWDNVNSLYSILGQRGHHILHFGKNWLHLFEFGTN